MQFEYDPNKSEAYQDKHGIDFEEAQQLWFDPNMMRFDIEYGGESRWGIIAHYEGSYWVAICATRGERTRSISVRRATQKEASFYDKANNER